MAWLEVDKQGCEFITYKRNISVYDTFERKYLVIDKYTIEKKQLKEGAVESILGYKITYKDGCIEI